MALELPDDAGTAEAEGFPPRPTDSCRWEGTEEGELVLETVEEFPFTVPSCNDFLTDCFFDFLPKNIRMRNIFRCSVGFLVEHRLVPYLRVNKST